MNHEGAKDTKEEGRRRKEEGRREGFVNESSNLPGYFA
jgi:hypothetical protein